MVTVSGFGKERLMNLCGKRGVYIWDIRNEKDLVVFSIFRKDYEMLNILLDKTATKVVLVEKHGLPFLFAKIKKRTNLLFGLAFGTALVCIMQCFIWKVQIEGNEKVTGSQFEKFMIDEGINIPSLSTAIDCYELKDEILSAFKDISWVSIEKKGSSLRIVIKEKNDVIDIKTRNLKERDLYAKNDGRIVSIVTRSGIPFVKEGDMVKRGDLLVSGEIPIYDETGTVKSRNLCIADADIVVESDICRHIYIPFDYKNKQYIKTKKYPWLYIGGKEFSPVKNLNQESNMEIVKEYSCQNRLDRLSNEIGFGYYFVNWYDYKIESYTDQEKNSMIQEKTDYLIKRMSEKNITIKQKNVTIQKNDKNWDIIVNFRIWTKQ